MQSTFLLTFSLVPFCQLPFALRWKNLASTDLARFPVRRRPKFVSGRCCVRYFSLTQLTRRLGERMKESRERREGGMRTGRGFGPDTSKRGEIAGAAKDDIARAPVLAPSEDQIGDFKSLLTEYGRAIIRSAIDHPPEKFQCLKQNIITAKEKIIVKHKTVENELKIAEREIRKLRTSVTDLTDSKATTFKQLTAETKEVEALRAENTILSAQRTESSNQCKKEIAKRKALEGELATFKQDKKRKRESAASIWEEVEQTKLD